jgi:acyl carrier protein
MPTEDELLDLIAQTTKLDRSKFVREAPLTSLGIESLDVVEVIFALEEKYDIEIPFNANSRNDALTGAVFSTVGDIVDQVQALVQKRAAAAVAS